MDSVEKIRQTLLEQNAHFRILSHEREILSVKDAAGLFDTEKMAPVLIVTDSIDYMAVIFSAERGGVDFEKLARLCGAASIRLARPKEVLEQTGYPVGSVPLVGHSLPCLFDKKLLRHDVIYGCTGDARKTLEIDPRDVLRLNHIQAIFELNE